MTAQPRSHKRIVRPGSQPPLALRLLAVAVAPIAAATTFVAPAHADPIGNPFGNILNNNAPIAGNNPIDTAALGQAICPILAKPGGTFTSVVSSMQGNYGMPPQMANMVTSMAVSMFCPGVVASLANGNLPFPVQLPGLGAQPPGPGLQLPGLGAQPPGPGFQLPGLGAQPPGPGLHLPGL